MIQLSSRQYALLKQLPNEFGVDLAQRYNQTTFGSFGMRAYVKRYGNKFKVTKVGKEALADFGHAEVFRKLASEKLSIHFREVLVMRRAG